MRRVVLALGLIVATAVTHHAVRAQQRSTGVQTTTVVTRARLLLAVDRMLYDRWYPTASVPLPPIHPDDRGMLTAALVSDDPSLRALAIRLTGRFEDARDVPTLTAFIGDRNPAIREEAMLAIAQALSTSTSPETDAVVDLLEARALQDPSVQVVDAVIGALGNLEYRSSVFKRVESRLVSLIRMNHERVPSDVRSVVALEALEHLYQRNRGRVPGVDTLPLLLNLAKPLPPQMPVEAALRILQASGTATREVVIHAARFTCVYAPPQGPPPPVPRCNKDSGAGVRILGLGMMSSGDPAFLPYFEEAAEDSAHPDIQAEAFRKLAESGREKIRCATLLQVVASQEPETPVRTPAKLRAIDLIAPKCEEIGELLSALKTLVEQLADQSSDRRWHVPAAALVKLAAVAPEEAAPLVKRLALSSGIWQVRMAAADAAQLTRDESSLLQLTSDGDHNVRTEAISALARLHSPAVSEAALRALDSDDVQLVIVAAVALRELRTEEERVAAAADLSRALERLTREGRDTSRTARLEILRRLKEFGRPDEAGRSALLSFRSSLDPLLRDFDPIVAEAAADTIREISGVRTEPRPTYRAPQQPSESDLDELSQMRPAFSVTARSRFSVSAHAVLELDDGQRIPLTFLTADAPVAVARFLKLARDGYYNGHTFYRVLESGALFGGSPGANDYAADDRFWRDEIASPALFKNTQEVRMLQGPGRRNDQDDPHERKALEMLTHGRDTGDGRFALVPLRAARSRATVFAEVPGGIEPVLEGTKVVRVLAPAQRAPR